MALCEFDILITIIIGPDTLDVSVIPVYSYEAGNLSKIMLESNELVSLSSRSINFKMYIM